MAEEKKGMTMRELLEGKNDREVEELLGIEKGHFMRVNDGQLSDILNAETSKDMVKKAVNMFDVKNKKDDIDRK